MKIQRHLCIALLAMMLASCDESGMQQSPPPGSTTSGETAAGSGSDSQELSSQAAEAAALAEAKRKAAEAEIQAQRQASEAYLHINAQKPGVQELRSGVQFEIIESGDGRSPSPTSRVVTHYHGTLVNGEVFDSSIERGKPATFPVNRVIRGWQEVLPMMKEGDIWRVVIPADQAYGKRGAGGGRIPPYATLIFELELIEVLQE